MQSGVHALPRILTDKLTYANISNTPRRARPRLRPSGVFSRPGRLALALSPRSSTSQLMKFSFGTIRKPRRSVSRDGISNCFTARLTLVIIKYARIMERWRDDFIRGSPDGRRGSARSRRSASGSAMGTSIFTGFSFFFFSCSAIRIGAIINIERITG